MAEDQLWTGQSTGPLADLVSKSKALSDRQNGLDDEHVCPFLHLLMEDATLSLPQDTIYSAWEGREETQDQDILNTHRRTCNQIPCKTVFKKSFFNKLETRIQTPLLHEACHCSYGEGSCCTYYIALNIRIL